MSYNDRTAGLYIAEKDVSSNDYSCHSNTGELRSCNSLPSAENKLSSAPQSSGTQPASCRSESSTIPIIHSAVKPADNMEQQPAIDRNMPATEIGRKTIKMLSQLLRPPKLGAKYWEDMAEEMGFNYQREIKNFALAPDPVDEVLTAWSTKKGSTVGKLMDILEDIERDDVLSELPKFLGEFFVNHLWSERMLS